MSKFRWSVACLAAGLMVAMASAKDESRRGDRGASRDRAPSRENSGGGGRAPEAPKISAPRVSVPRVEPRVAPPRVEPRVIQPKIEPRVAAPQPAPRQSERRAPAPEVPRSLEVPRGQSPRDESRGARALERLQDRRQGNDAPRVPNIPLPSNPQPQPAIPRVQPRQPDVRPVPDVRQVNPSVQIPQTGRQPSTDSSRGIRPELRNPVPSQNSGIVPGADRRLPANDVPRIPNPLPGNRLPDRRTESLDKTPRIDIPGPRPGQNPQPGLNRLPEGLQSPSRSIPELTKPDVSRDRGRLPNTNLPNNTLPGSLDAARGGSPRPGAEPRRPGIDLPADSPNLGNRGDGRRDGRPEGDPSRFRIPGGLDESRGKGPARPQDRSRLPQRSDLPIVGEQKTAVPLQVPKINRVDLNSRERLQNGRADSFELVLKSRDHRELRQNLDLIKQSPDLSRHPQLAHMKLDKISGLHQDRLDRDDSFQNWRRTRVGQELDLDRQFQLQRRGDLARQLNLNVRVNEAGGWRHRNHGVIAANYTKSSFSVWYAGGGCFPTHCWYPRWSSWVNWCWWDTCIPFYDPRPIYCRPVVYQPCQPWVFYSYPVWQPLPVVTCGTWVDVAPIVVPAGLDLQLLAVRFVDNGHPEQNLGPRYRIWIRNNSPVQIVTPFSVLAMASNDVIPSNSLPQSGVVIPTMDIGEVKPVDVRLPLEANRMVVTADGHHVPFGFLHVLVDSHQQVAETIEGNNGSVVARQDILPVDPAAFSTDQTAASPGTTLTIAGEGFGPEPGQVLVSIGGQQTEATILGWYDLGIQFTVPNYLLTGVVDAEILVVRGDGAVSNPLDLDVGPATMIGQPVTLPPVPGLD